MAKYALLIGNSIFVDDQNFPQLSAAANDVSDFPAVLKEYGNFEVIETLLDANVDKIKYAIEDFYTNQAQRGDLTLLYYSGHGYKSLSGEYFLVARNTNVSVIFATGIEEVFIRNVMRGSRSRHHIIIFDSCFSGKFIKGRKGGKEPLLLEDLKGEATALLTSSGAVEYSYIKEQGRNSLFTHYLLEGIRTGQADEDRDGEIKVNELFDYAAHRVKIERPDQIPMIAFSKRDTEIVIAKNPKELDAVRSFVQSRVIKEHFYPIYIPAHGLDGYEYLELLGRGSSSEVYKVRSKQDGKILALKKFDSPNTLSKDRFEYEVEIGKRLQHPHIVQVYDGRDENGIWYMVMEYMEGGTLQNRLSSKQPLSIDSAIQIIGQICDAVYYVHQRGLYDLNIKPYDILFNNDQVSKLSDFGFTRRIQSGQQAAPDRDLGSVAIIMAPEQWTKGESDHRTDIFALGAILYQMTTGQLPFHNKNNSPPRIMYSILNEPPFPPRNINPNIPNQVEQVILRAMEKDPEQRFSSAQEMALALGLTTADFYEPSRSPNYSEKPRFSLNRLKNFIKKS